MNPSPTDETFDEKCRFIVAIGRAAHRSGMTAPRLEALLGRISTVLDIRGQFSATPETLQFEFQPEGDPWTRSIILRMPGPDFSMTRLTGISELMDEVAAGKLTVAERNVRLEEISKAPGPWGAAAVGLAYVLIGGAFAILFAASWTDAALGALFSAVVYGFVLLAGRVRWIGASLELLSAAVVGVLAGAAAAFLPGSNAPLVVICALVVLVPGFGLVIGIGEMSANHVISGLMRLTSALMVTFKLFLGSVIGLTLAGRLFPLAPVADTAPMSPIFTWVSIVMLVLGLSLVFQVRPKDLALVIGGGLAAWVGVTIGNSFGAWQGSFLSAFILVAYANFVAWRLGRPSSVVLVPCVLILVPGASAWQGLNAFITQGIESGVTAELHVFTVSCAILGGLIVGNIVVRPRQVM